MTTTVGSGPGPSPGFSDLEVDAAIEAFHLRMLLEQDAVIPDGQVYRVASRASAAATNLPTATTVCSIKVASEKLHPEFGLSRAMLYHEAALPPSHVTLNKPVTLTCSFDDDILCAVASVQVKPSLRRFI